jgi:hypothetical protein
MPKKRREFSLQILDRETRSEVETFRGFNSKKSAKDFGKHFAGNPELIAEIF